MQFFEKQLRKDQRKLAIYQENSKVRRDSLQNVRQLAEIHKKLSEIQEKNLKNMEKSPKIATFRRNFAKTSQFRDLSEDEGPFPRKPVRKHQETAEKAEEEANFKGNSRESTSYSEKAEVLLRNWEDVSQKRGIFKEKQDNLLKNTKFRSVAEKSPAWKRENIEEEFAKLEEMLQKSRKARENLLEIQLELLQFV